MCAGQMFKDNRKFWLVLAATLPSRAVLVLWMELYSHWTRNLQSIPRITIRGKAATDLEHWLFAMKRRGYCTVYRDGQVTSWPSLSDIGPLLLTYFLPFLILGCCHDTCLWQNSELKLKQHALFSPVLFPTQGFQPKKTLFQHSNNHTMPQCQDQKRNSIST